MTEMEQMEQIRSLVCDFIVAATYKNDLSYHTERDTFIRVKNDLKETIMSKVKDALLNNELLKDQFQQDELYQDLLNDQAVQIAQLEEQLFKARIALDSMHNMLNKFKKEVK
jgi:hypothetical protein